MAVQGVEIKVGQKWRTRGGDIVEISTFDAEDLVLPWGSAIGWYWPNGKYYVRSASYNDLIELIEDVAAPSAELPVQFADPDPADADALASETLTALGYHFDGQCWVANGEPGTLEQHPLYAVFVDAISQAMYGKGQRHGGATVPFLDQPIFHYAKMHGRGFLTGQAAKKLEEAASTRSGDAFITEVLGALVYAGAAIINERGAK